MSKKVIVSVVMIAMVAWAIGLAAVVPVSAYTAQAGDYVKTATDTAVYYINADGERQLFSNLVTFRSWNNDSWGDLVDSGQLQIISQDDFDMLDAGNNVTTRPGVNLISFDNSPKTYAVSPGAVLSHVTDSAAAEALFGSGWASRVVTIQAAFETNYSKTGDALTASSNLPDGSLVKYSGSEDVYYIEDGEKRLVEDDAFVANGLWDSSVVTVPASMTYDLGSSITGEEAAISSVDGVTGPGGGTAADGTLAVSLSADTPSAGLAIFSASRVPFTTVSLTAGADADVTVDSVTIERLGPATDSVFSSVALVNGDTNVQIGLNQNLSSSHRANVNNDFVVPAGTTMKIVLAGTMSASTGAGQVPALALAGVAVKGGATVVGSLPIVGNGQTVTSLTIGTATMQRGTYENATSTTLKVGETGYIIASYKVSANSTEGQSVTQIKYYQQGTASLTSDLGNFQLLVNNSTPVDAVFTVDGKYLTAEFSSDSVDMEKGKNKEITLKADVLGGSTRTIDIGIYRNTDVMSVGSTYGYSRVVGFSGTGQGGTAPILSSNQFTISAGTLRVESSSSVPSQDVSYGDEQVLGAFNFVVAGESVSITNLVLTNSSTTVDSNQFDNVKLINADTNEVLWGPSSADSANADDITYTSTVQLPVGTTEVNVVADVESAGGWLTNATFYYTVDPSNITATGVDTDETISATPSAGVNASTMTFKPGKLVITRKALPADGNVVLGSNDVLHGAWAFDTTGSGEDVRITAITLANHAGTSTSVDNLTLYDTSVSSSDCTSEYPNASYDASFGCKLQPINDATAGTSTFTLTDPMVMTKNTNKTLELRGDVRETAGSYSGLINEFIMLNDGDTAPITAVGVLTGNDVTPTGSGYEATDGADITIVGSGTLTVNTSASSPASRLLATGQTYELGRIKLSATNEAIDVTDLSICIDDGDLTGAVGGDEDDVATISVYKATDMATPIATRSMSQVCEAFTLNAGTLTVPKDDNSGVDLVVKGTMASIGTGQTGTANADVRIGIGGAAGIRGTGVDSGLAATETYTASTSSGMVLHKGYPTVTINSPATTLSSGVALYDVTISNPTSEAIAVYRLTFWMTTSSGDIGVTTGGLQAKRSDWSSFKQIAADATPTFVDDVSVEHQSFVLYNPDSVTQTKKELQLGAGQSVQFQYIARAVDGLDGTSGESIQVSMLGDTASTTIGNTGDGFTALDKGNFTWSDMYSNTGSTSNGASTTAQWYNGYLVDGLQSTTTVKSISE